MTKDCLYCGTVVSLRKPILCAIDDKWLWHEGDSVHLVPFAREHLTAVWCDRECLSAWAIDHAKRDLEFIAEEAGRE